MDKPDFKTICLLHIQNLTNFPYIEKDFDALTDYGLLCKIVEKMNEVITNNNIQNETINTLYNSFIELKDYVDTYFENLDLQEEVDTKLEEMATSGELALLLNKAISQKIQVQTLGINPGTLTNNDVDTINTYIENNPYCSLEFGSGVYELPKSIVLLQGSSISGIGNDTVLKPQEDVWAIICKGLSTLNSTTNIYNLTIDGNFEGNGIYIDGTRYSRCEIHDLFITSCIYGIRNAVPTTAGVYDNNYQVGSGGNNLHDLYITGETPNDDTSRCIDGLVLFANDNFITNVRVSGFGNYGVLLNGSGNQFTMLKSAVNHIAFRCNGGGQNFGTICAEESFQNNFELYYVRNSYLDLKTSAAGCVVAGSLPSQLQYYDVYMENCSNNKIDINGFVAQSFTYRKAGELAMLNIQDSVLNDIHVNYGNSQVPNEYALPIISNCAFANNIFINNQSYEKFITYNLLDSVTLQSVSNITVTGTYPNLTVANASTNTQQNLLGFVLTDYFDDDLVIVDNCFNTYPPQVFLISYKFNEVTTVYSYTSPTVFHSSYGQNGCALFKMNIKEILETQADYISNVQLGNTLQYARVYLRCTHAQQGTSQHELAINVEE